MTKRMRTIGTIVLIMLGLAASPAQAQSTTIDLAAGGAEQTWRGVEPGARAGLWLDQGAVSGSDSRRDLIVGAPGDAGTVGRVYILFGGPVRSGDFTMATAEASIVGASAGDLFGSGTAAGNILNLEGQFPRNLVVGAPGAGGGRGAVYLFTGGFREGDSLTASNAVLTIIGNIGDQIGSAIATADLNNDGRREIIMGAPGTGRIYVINGSASLSGTIDLSAASANSIITGAGIGTVITAGDVTGDDISDLLIGVPTFSNSRGVVYLLTGGTLPSSVSLPSAASATFTGIDANDLAGSSIRIADVDADGRRDILISAPGGDGPTGSRTDAGETYIIWGTSGAPASMTLSSAPVTIFGDAPSARLGAFVTAGDINRDVWNDVVLLAPGAAGSTGQLCIYYGRNRSTIGTVQADGRRFVDFAVAGQMDRRILSDASAGPFVSAQVYEVTGEGARDIVVTSPYAATDSGALSGNVYFTISAKLNVSPSVVELGAAQGGVGTTSFEVRDYSTIEITWAATPNQPWLTVSPGSGTAVDGSPASLTVSANAMGMAPGSYSGVVTVKSTSRELEMSLPVGVTFNVLTLPTLTSSTAFPVQAGTPITFNASTSGGTGSFQYKFYRYKYGAGWTMVQDYGSSNTYSWTPAPADTGTYVLQVWVRTTGSTASYEAYQSSDAFSILPAKPNLTALRANVGFPAATGTPITFTADATGGIAPLQYKFWRYKSGAGWTVARDWSTANSFSWTPGASDVGTYTLQAWVRNAGSTGDADAWKALDFTISNSAAVQIQSVTANRTFPAGTGTPITWTAIASGGSAGPLQYKFWRYNNTSGSWTLAQDYSAANTYTWTPAYGDVGTYTIQVWVRSAGSSATYEAWAATSSFSIVRSAVTIMSLTASRTFPSAPGTAITWTATATGGSGTLEYKFYRYKYGSGWTLVRDYGSSNTYTWTPGAGDTGDYVLQVWVRSVGSGVDYEAYVASDVFRIQ
jgi:Viral BACON domain/FG-GAP repeat